MENRQNRPPYQEPENPTERLDTNARLARMEQCLEILLAQGDARQQRAHESSNERVGVGARIMFEKMAGPLLTELSGFNQQAELAKQQLITLDELKRAASEADLQGVLHLDMLIYLDGMKKLLLPEWSWEKVRTQLVNASPESMETAAEHAMKWYHEMTNAFRCYKMTFGSPDGRYRNTVDLHKALGASLHLWAHVPTADVAVELNQKYKIMPNALKTSATNVFKALGTELTSADELLLNFARNLHEGVAVQKEVRRTAQISSGKIVGVFVPPMVRKGTGIIRPAEVVVTA